MIGKWGFSLLPFYLGIIPIFANNNYTLTNLSDNTACRRRAHHKKLYVNNYSHRAFSYPIRLAQAAFWLYTFMPLCLPLRTLFIL